MMFCTFVVVLLSTIFSLSLGVPLDNVDVASYLTTLQSDHYTHVRKTLSEIKTLAAGLFFVDVDLKHNAEIYLNTVASKALETLEEFRENCESNNTCLSCFNNVYKIREIALRTSAELVEYFDDKKRQYDQSIQQIADGIQDSALLTNEVYQLYGSEPDFKTQAASYYATIQKAYASEVSMLEGIVAQTNAVLIKRNVDVTAHASDDIKH